MLHVHIHKFFNLIVELNKYKNNLDKKIQQANEQTGIEDKLFENFNRRSMSISHLTKSKQKDNKEEEQVNSLLEKYKLEKDKSIKNSFFYSLQKEQLHKNLKKRDFDINSLNYLSDINDLKKLKGTLVFEEVNAKKVPFNVKIIEKSKKVRLYYILSV